MTRPRNRLNRNLPPNLYMSKKGKKYYFRYRHPITGKESGMGSDRVRAVRAANELNAKLMPPEVDLVARVIGGTGRMSEWLDDYSGLLEKKDIADATRKSYRGFINVIRKGLGDYDLAAIDTPIAVDYLRRYESTPQMAKQLRARLKDIFDEAIREGKIKDNPINVTRNPKVTVMRERLFLDDFNMILDKAETMNPWVSNSMLLGLITGQRLNDIANMRFSDISDNYLHIKQHKSGSLVRLSLDLRLDAIGMSVSDVVSRCRDRVVSRHLIHHAKSTANTKAGAPLKRLTISKGFKDARNRSGLKWEHPPSFHELRSLSGRLYADQGVDAQSLLGHKDAQTTALYLDDKGEEWISVG